MTESEWLARLRPLAGAPEARGLLDDAAVLDAGGALVLTQDMLVEGVHFLADDPPDSIAWKLVAVNLSDLAAKGASPVGILLGYPLLGDGAWDSAFISGLESVLTHHVVPLLGGDTVAPGGGRRTLVTTALGRAHPSGMPSRAGARPGQGVWVTGTLGDAGAGLRSVRGALPYDDHLVARYRRPEPRLAEGRALCPHASAMMDVSDGLLIDLSRLLAASNAGATMELSALPLSPSYRRLVGETRAARLAAATAGDDYELLFTCNGDPPVPATRIGEVVAGSGLQLVHDGEPVPLPPSLGWEHAG